MGKKKTAETILETGKQCANGNWLAHLRRDLIEISKAQIQLVYNKNPRRTGKKKIVTLVSTERGNKGGGK